MDKSHTRHTSNAKKNGLKPPHRRINEDYDLVHCKACGYDWHCKSWTPQCPKCHKRIK